MLDRPSHNLHDETYVWTFRANNEEMVEHLADVHIAWMRGVGIANCTHHVDLNANFFPVSVIGGKDLDRDLGSVPAYEVSIQYTCRNEALTRCRWRARPSKMPRNQASEPEYICCGGLLRGRLDIEETAEDLVA